MLTRVAVWHRGKGGETGELPETGEAPRLLVLCKAPLAGEWREGTGRDRGIEIAVMNTGERGEGNARGGVFEKLEER
jgi:hypothetical protein